MRCMQRWQAKYGIVSSGDPSSTGFGVVGPRSRAALAACQRGAAQSYQSQSPSIIQRSATPSAITPQLQANLSSGAAPLTVVFSPSGLTSGAYYTIDFGDSVMSPVFGGYELINYPTNTTASLAHIYSGAGNYTAKLEIADPSAGACASNTANCSNGGAVLALASIAVESPTPAPVQSCPFGYTGTYPNCAAPSSRATQPASSPNISLLSPVAGQNLPQGSTLMISWQSQNPPAGSAVSLLLYNGRLATSGSYSFNIPSASELASSGQCQSTVGHPCGGLLLPGSFDVSAQLYIPSGTASSQQDTVATVSSGLFTVTQ